MTSLEANLEKMKSTEATFFRSNSLEATYERMDVLEAKLEKVVQTITPWDLAMGELDLTIYQNTQTLKKVETKLERHEPLLRRILGFRECMDEIVAYEHAIAGAVKDMHRSMRNLPEEELSQDEGQTEDEEEIEEGASSEAEDDADARPQQPVAGPAKWSPGLETPEVPCPPFVSGPETNQAKPPLSPDVTMTTPTPINSQDDAQETTTIVPANTVVPTVADKVAPTPRLPHAPACNPTPAPQEASLLAPTGSTATEPTHAPAGDSPPTCPAAPAPSTAPSQTPSPAPSQAPADVHLPGPNAPAGNPSPGSHPSHTPTLAPRTPADVPPLPSNPTNASNSHLSPPGPIEGSLPVQQPRGPNPTTGDRRSPRLANSRAPSPAPQRPPKRAPEDDAERETKRAKIGPPRGPKRASQDVKGGETKRTKGGPP
jgi:hypothetical protein